MKKIISIIIFVLLFSWPAAADAYSGSMVKLKWGEVLVVLPDAVKTGTFQREFAKDLIEINEDRGMISDFSGPNICILIVNNNIPQVIGLMLFYTRPIKNQPKERFWIYKSGMPKEVENPVDFFLAAEVTADEMAEALKGDTT